MRPLFVDAIAPKEIRMLGGRLIIREKGGGTELASFDVRSQKEQYDVIAISGRRGYVTFEAHNFLNAFGIPIYWLDVDGKLLGVDVPNSSRASGTRQLWQLRAAANPATRLQTAKAIVSTKLRSNGQEDGVGKVETTQSLKALNGVEAHYANLHFREIFGDYRRSNFAGYHYRAKDRVSCLLNYAFGIAKGQALRLIIGNSLNPSVGFIHNHGDAFNFDIEEWYRWAAEQAARELADKAKRDDFDISTDYTHRLSPFTTLKRELIERLGALEENRIFGLDSAHRVRFEEWVQRRLDTLVRSWGYHPHS
jgi:CRISPR/Cas system-associated endonuclease Cas1